MSRPHRDDVIDGRGQDHFTQGTRIARMAKCAISAAHFVVRVA